MYVSASIMFLIERVRQLT